MLWSDIGTARRSEPSQLKDRGKGGGGQEETEKNLGLLFWSFLGRKVSISMANSFSLQ